MLTEQQILDGIRALMRKCQKEDYDLREAAEQEVRVLKDEMQRKIDAVWALVDVHRNERLEKIAGYQRMLDAFNIVPDQGKTENIKAPVYTIQTKRMPSGEFSCYGTIKGYDHAFTGPSVIYVQEKMKDHLLRTNVENVVWEEVVYYDLRENHQDTFDQEGNPIFSKATMAKINEEDDKFVNDKLKGLNECQVNLIDNLGLKEQETVAIEEPTNIPEQTTSDSKNPVVEKPVSLKNIKLYKAQEGLLGEGTSVVEMLTGKQEGPKVQNVEVKPVSKPYKKKEGNKFKGSKFENGMTAEQVEHNKSILRTDRRFPNDGYSNKSSLEKYAPETPE